MRCILPIGHSHTHLFAMVASNEWKCNREPEIMPCMVDNAADTSDAADTDCGDTDMSVSDDIRSYWLERSEITR